MSLPRSVCLLYLGRRGGGAKYCSYLAQQLKINFADNYVSVGLRRDIENLKEFDRINPVFLLDKGYSLPSYLHLIKFHIRPELLLQRLQIKTGDVCFIPMISPIGFLLERLLTKKGVVVYRVLHDAKRHPGDLWPLSRTLRRIIKKSETLITLSSSVSEQVKSLNPSVKIIELRHPVFSFEEDVTESNPYGNYILFVGRIRKYKGVGNLVTAFSSLRNSSLNLVIAGSGKLPEIKNPRIIVVNRWLEESEITKLVRDAQLVVFPYVEASQSGLIPYCISQNKPLVITPLPGLREQVVGYTNTWITNDATSSSLARAIEEALNQSTRSNSRGRIPSSNIDELEKLRLLIES